AHDVPLGCAPDEYDDLISGTCSHLLLVYFSEYLSKNNYVFWSELLLVPLLLSGAVFFFRVIMWNNENIETVYWNKTRLDYYQELLQKGRPILRSLSYRSDCLI
ncbi:hypothetical protein ACVPW9_22380, partial [Klebsiella pneumoniae]